LSDTEFKRCLLASQFCF